MTTAAADLQAFGETGFSVLRGAATPEVVAAMLAVSQRELGSDRQPLEREADVQYPGSPANREAPGGMTVRRLLRAYDRDPVFAEWVRAPVVVDAIREILGTSRLWFSQAHHNCVMTKRPRYSSDTGWHQDIRYWRFSDARLVNAWLALTDETPANGALRVIPGSHRAFLDSARFDAALFLREDLPANRPLFETAVQLTLAPGDLILFDAALFHAASRNSTQQTKFSAIFTYHGPGTQPLPDTRSASLPEIAI